MEHDLEVECTGLEKGEKRWPYCFYMTSVPLVVFSQLTTCVEAVRKRSLTSRLPRLERRAFHRVVAVLAAGKFRNCAGCAATFMKPSW